MPVTALRRQPGTRREERRAGSIGELSVGGSVVPAAAEATAVAVLDSIVGGIEVAADIRAPWRGECRRCLRPLSGELHCQVRELYRPRDGDAVHGKGPVRQAAGGQHQRPASPGGLGGQGAPEGHGGRAGMGGSGATMAVGAMAGTAMAGTGVTAGTATVGSGAMAGTATVGTGGHGGRRHHRDQARWDADLDEDTYPLEGDQLDLRPLVRDALLLEPPLAPLCRDDCRGLCADCGADLNLGPCQCLPALDARWQALDVLRGAGEDEGAAT